MQTRHRHFIRPVTQCRYPSCIVAVTCDGECSPVGDGSSESASVLTAWTACTATLSSGEVKSIRASEGVCEADWWRYITSVLSHQSAILIVSYGAWRDSILLGFWQRLEDGRIYLSGIDCRQTNDSYARRKPSTAGYWVLENPPTILNFRLRDKQGACKWLDIRNFGFLKWTEISEKSISSACLLQTLLAVVTFLRQNNLGSLQATVASQALYSFKYRFLKHSIHVSTNETQNLLGQDALFGGRNECYRLGSVQGPITQLDFNSLYPSVYGREAVPIRLQSIRSNPSQSYIKAAIAGKNCIARVLCDTSVPCIPKRRGGNLIFPVGRFRTALCWPELELALENANHVRITEIGTYDLAPCLAEFANTLYPIRQRAKQGSNGVLASYIKALLVSLPGKFGQRCRRWQLNGKRNYQEPWKVWYAKGQKGKYTRHRSVATYVEEELDNGLGYESVPEIAAWVTSWGRRILWGEMCRVGREKIIYVDTDSIWHDGRPASSIHEQAISSNVKMGELRKVGTYGQVSFHGLKHYEADGTATPRFEAMDAIKGYGNNAGNVLASGIMECCSRQTAPIKASGRRLGTGCGEYRHGRVQPDLTVKPLELEEW